MADLKVQEKSYIGLTTITILFIGLIVIFFYLDRHNQLSILFRSWGLGGVLLSILFMTALSMTPIPSEGLLLLLFKIYGVYEGIFFAWLGANLSSLVIFYLARYYGQKFFEKLITPNRFATVDNWIHRKGTFGLFIARLLPLPAFAVNYIAGMLPSVKLWPYMWTAAITIIPYYVGTALIYTGVAKATWTWLIAGSLAIIAIWAISYYLSKADNGVEEHR